VARHEVADAHHSLKGSRAVQKKSNPVRRKTIFAKDFIGTPEQLTAYSKLLFGAARCAGRLVGNKPRCLLVDPRCVLVDNLRQLRTLTEAVK
jgi:hypothetical protein